MSARVGTIADVNHFDAFTVHTSNGGVEVSTVLADCTRQVFTLSPTQANAFAALLTVAAKHKPRKPGSRR